MNKNKTILILSSIITLLLAFIIIGFVLINNSDDEPSDHDQDNEISITTESNSIFEIEDFEVETEDVYIAWENRDGEWIPFGNPTECPVKIELTMPVDISKVTHLLYPGQYRGNDFKAHGGFRFDNSTSDEIVVTAPFDAYVYRGSQYLGNGEKQYWFDFITPCGLMYRFDHFYSLSPELAELAEELPEATEGDSRSTNFSQPLVVQKGDILATAVGFPEQNNIFVDLGIYDLNQKNEASVQPGWDELVNIDAETDPYGLCWLDFLPEDQENILRALPTGKEGKVSEYCID